jgi:hypothetical protein
MDGVVQRLTSLAASGDMLQPCLDVKHPQNADSITCKAVSAVPAYTHTAMVVSMEQIMQNTRKELISNNSAAQTTNTASQN